MSETETTTTAPERDQVAARWAEQAMTLPANSTTALRGDAAAAHGRSLLEDAVGGPEALEAAVRGRKTLGRARPAGRSPKRQATLPEELDRRGLAFIQAGGAHDYSALMRAALAEYLDQHASAEGSRQPLAPGQTSSRQRSTSALQAVTPSAVDGAVSQRYVARRSASAVVDPSHEGSLARLR